MESSPEIIHFILIGILGLLLSGIVLALLLNVAQRKHLEAQLKAQQDKLQEQDQLFYGVIFTQEEELERFAKVLHDEIGSRLNVVHLFLHRLSAKAPNTTITDLLEVVDDTIHSTRRMSQDLLPLTLQPFGLCTALKELCDRMSRPNELRVSFDCQGDRPPQFEKLVEITLFRVLDELINNSLTFANVSQIYVHLFQSPYKIALQYQDDGQGYESGQKNIRKDHALHTLHSRLRAIGAAYQLHTQPGEGIRVQIDVPLSQPLLPKL
ncbi:MAG: sensor histidine kinase [Bacteroidia bacterium]|nr:sensor histidine kinase [Bacteroidia bacterium]